MNVAIYPGSFDPLTNGHIDIIKRANKFVDILYIAILNNPQKNCLFSLQERKQLIEYEFRFDKTVQVVTFTGLLIDFMKENNICAIIKGLRTSTDYEYEAQMALMNNNLYSYAETFFILSRAKYSCVSSSIIKEIHGNGGDVTEYVPMHVKGALDSKVNNSNRGEHRDSAPSHLSLIGR